MARELKVFGGRCFVSDGNFYDQVRALVCARTKKRALELINKYSNGRTNMKDFNDFWSEASNEQELELDIKEDEFWYTKGMYRPDKEYIKLIK